MSARADARWLANAFADAPPSVRILKIGEEFGEAVQAFIGVRSVREPRPSTTRRRPSTGAVAKIERKEKKARKKHPHAEALLAAIRERIPDPCDGEECGVELLDLTASLNKLGLKLVPVKPSRPPVNPSNGPRK